MDEAIHGTIAALPRDLAWHEVTMVLGNESGCGDGSDRSTYGVQWEALSIASDRSDVIAQANDYWTSIGLESNVDAAAPVPAVFATSSWGRLSLVARGVDGSLVLQAGSVCY